jgi:hypothetical protein
LCETVLDPHDRLLTRGMSRYRRMLILMTLLCILRPKFGLDSSGILSTYWVCKVFSAIEAPEFSRFLLILLPCTVMQMPEENQCPDAILNKSLCH